MWRLWDLAVDVFGTMGVVAASSRMEGEKRISKRAGGQLADLSQSPWVEILGRRQIVDFLRKVNYWAWAAGNVNFWPWPATEPALSRLCSHWNRRCSRHMTEIDEALKIRFQRWWVSSRMRKAFVY